MITYEQARALLDELQPLYENRHADLRRLRDFYHGRYWQDAENEKRGIAGIFRDIVSARDDIGPDLKLVNNLLHDVCVKYQAFMSTVPMIRTFTDRPTRTARAQAQLKENALYGTWAGANMNQQLNRIGWFGPLMGDSFLGIWPDLDHNCLYAIVRSPEWAYPVMSFDGHKLDAVMFCWKTTPAAAKRAFPNWDGQSHDETSQSIEVLEYSDSRQFVRWVGGSLTNAIEHDYGFNLFDQVPFIHVPGEPWNHGAVEQIVTLTEAGNILYSLMMQAAFENVFPRLVLEDPIKFSENIDTGPGAVLPVNPGGKAYLLTAAGAALSEGVGILQANERFVKQSTGMPDSSFGVANNSVITGKAINALQGAGTGSIVESVQGTGIGPALVAWNEKALSIYQRVFRDDQINLYGTKPSTGYDVNPRQFQLSFKGKDIVGSPRNEVVFSPYMDQHGKLVMALQAQGAGLTSKQYGREQIGISDTEEMQEQITAEVIEEAVIGALIQALQADPSEDAADKTEAQVAAYLSGKPGQPGLRAPAQPQPPPGQPMPGGGPPPGGGGGMPVAPLPGGGAVAAPAIELPPGASLGTQAGAPVPPDGGAPPPATPAPAGVTLPTAQAALARADLTGRAWLVGEIVAKGKANTVEVAITDPADKVELQNVAEFPVTFHVVNGEPKEDAVEITAGAPGG